MRGLGEEIGGGRYCLSKCLATSSIFSQIRQLIQNNYVFF